MLAIDRAGEWKLSVIMEVRYDVPYDADAQFWEIEKAVDATAAENGLDEPAVSNGMAQANSNTAAPATSTGEESKAANGAAADQQDTVMNGCSTTNASTAAPATATDQAQTPRATGTAVESPEDADHEMNGGTSGAANDCENRPSANGN